MFRVECKMQGLKRRRGWWRDDGVWVCRGPLGAKYRLEEGLPSEEEAQEAETQMFRYPSLTLEIALKSPSFQALSTQS